MSNFIVNSIGRSADYVTSGIAKHMPNVTFENKKVLKTIDWIGENLAAPHTNRFIMGVTAICTQPFIDLSNKKVDDETRRASVARTLAKIIVGTSTGVAIRYGCIKTIEYCTKLPSDITSKTKNPRLRKLFTPSSAINGTLKNLNHYKKALGTILALGVMTFTNFLVDAPLTKCLTNHFITLIDKWFPLKNKLKENEVNHG